MKKLSALFIPGLRAKAKGFLHKSLSEGSKKSNVFKNDIKCSALITNDYLPPLWSCGL